MQNIFFNLIIFSFFTWFLFVFAEDNTIANQEVVLKDRKVDSKDEATMRDRKNPKGKKGKGKKILVPEDDILLNLDGKKKATLEQHPEERIEQADDEEQIDN